MCIECFANMYAIMCMPNAQRGQKRALDSQQPELLMFVSNHVDARGYPGLQQEQQYS